MVDAGIETFLRAYRVEGAPRVGTKRHKGIAYN
jgi:hypothetical protein